MQSTVWTWIQTEGIIVLLRAAVSAVLVELQRLIWIGSRLSHETKGSYRRVTPGAVIRTSWKIGHMNGYFLLGSKYNQSMVWNYSV